MTLLMEKDAPQVGERTRAARGRVRLREHLLGWLFVGPFALVYIAFLIAPLAYAAYLSLFQRKLIGGTSFVLFDNYLKAFTDPSFLSGTWFVIRFSLVAIPLQIGIALALALILDAVT